MPDVVVEVALQKLPDNLWPTTRTVVQIIDGIHTSTGLPWWATLSFAALGEHLLPHASRLPNLNIKQITQMPNEDTNSSVAHAAYRGKDSAAAIFCEADAGISSPDIHMAAGQAQSPDAAHDSSCAASWHTCSGCPSREGWSSKLAGLQIPDAARQSFNFFAEF